MKRFLGGLLAGFVIIVIAWLFWAGLNPSTKGTIHNLIVGLVGAIVGALGAFGVVGVLLLIKLVWGVESVPRAAPNQIVIHGPPGQWENQGQLSLPAPSSQRPARDWQVLGNPEVVDAEEVKPGAWG